MGAVGGWGRVGRSAGDVRLSPQDLQTNVLPCDGVDRIHACRDSAI